MSLSVVFAILLKRVEAAAHHGIGEIGFDHAGVNRDPRMAGELAFHLIRPDEAGVEDGRSGEVDVFDGHATPYE